MNRTVRIRILEKLAKQPESELTGRQSRKEIEKRLKYLKGIYDAAASELRNTRKSIESLQAKLESLQEREKSSKRDMNLCHDILRKMDFSNATDVRIGKDNDLAFAIDGKWCTYNDDTGEVAPYKRKSKQDSNEADDILDKLFSIDDELSEGINVEV